MHSSDRADWLIPTLLIALGAVPVAAGWIINLAFVEWILRTRPLGPTLSNGTPSCHAASNGVGREVSPGAASPADATIPA